MITADSDRAVQHPKGLAMFEKTSDRMLDRRSFMKLAGGTALGAALIDLNPRAIDKAFAAAPDIPAIKARFAMVSYPNHTWPIIGVRNGFFQDVGISLDPADGRIVFENQTVPLLQNKEEDVSTIFVGVLTPVLDKIKTIRPFLVHSYWQGNTILTSFAGMKLEDSDLVILEDPNAVQLAVSGGVPFSAPAGAAQIYQLQYQANWRPLISTRQLVKYAGGPDGAPVQKILNFDGFAATTDYIAANKDTIHRFNSVLYRTMAAMFGPDQRAELEKQVPFVNAANGSSLDAPAIKFIFTELDPFFPWDAQARLWKDVGDPLYYKNVYDYQVKKFIEDKTIAPGDYDLDALFPARAIWMEALAMREKAAALAEKASSAKLPDDKKALAEAGKAWAAKLNFLDATRFLEASLA